MSVLEIPLQFKWKLASKSEAMKREASRLWKFALRMKHLAVGRSVWFSPACSLVNFIFPCAQCAQCAQCALPIFQCEHLCPSYFVLTMYQVHIIKYINWCCNLSRFGIIDCFSSFNSGSSNVSPVFSTHGYKLIIQLRFPCSLTTTCSVHFDVCICQCFTTNIISRNRNKTISEGVSP